jgi:hypothetical protein
LAALQAKARWAISGTPIQNSLTDFLGLFKFLHFAPYDDAKIFDDEISQLWRDKPADEAAEIFRKLLSCVMIRRTKVILDLPARVDRILRVSFNEREKAYYRRVEQPAVELLDHSSETTGSPGYLWTNAIQQINKLRLVCNLGVHTPSRSSLDHTALAIAPQAVLAARLSMGEDTCAQCLGPASLPSIDEGLGIPTSSNAYYSACSLIYCAACTQLLQFQSPKPCGCADYSTPCRLLPLPSSIRTPRLTPTRETFVDSEGTNEHTSVSSKVQALVEQIKANPAEKK